MKSNNLFKKVKKCIKKIRYLDKTQSIYFTITTFILGFCLFTGITYSYFALTKQLDGATISIAKLKYDLSSPTADFTNNSITVQANTTTFLELNLKSLNDIQTKFTIDYQCESENVKVQFYRTSTEGLISTTNSIVDRIVVITNNNSSPATVTFKVRGGYTTNSLATSNITEEYIDNFSMPDAIKALKAGEQPEGVNTSTPNFDNEAQNDEGVKSIEDDYGTSYYYRGATTNNYVKFGKNALGNDMYWRIIRINGDGTVRMIYDGTSVHENGENNADRVALTDINWNTNTNDAKYVGYMYGGTAGSESTSKDIAQTNATNSTVKEALDNWYIDNILHTGFSSYVADSIFCNDRQTAKADETWWTNDTKLGYGNNNTAYAAYSRHKTTDGKWKTEGIQVTLKCTNKNDAFTVTDTSYGNSALTYPIGLITVDEVAVAGGRGGQQNQTYYLHKGINYATMTPNYYYTTKGAREFAVHENGNIYNIDFSSGIALAPVINLKAEYAMNMTGDGTADNPYTYKEATIEEVLAHLKITPKTGNPTFTSLALTDEGVYTYPDDYGTSYYYRGNITNNYVKFAGFYWRIIRVNGNGSVRMIYDGTTPHKNDEVADDRFALPDNPWNLTNVDDAKYVGYMYGGENGVKSTSKDQATTNSTNSNVKTLIDDWYETNILPKNVDYAIEDAIFCNDRSYTKGNGFGYDATYYSARNRLYENRTPQLKCVQKNDAFTVNDISKGNGALKYPIALPTGDEILLAGGVYYSGNESTHNKSFYLYKGTTYWTMTPCSQNDWGAAGVFGVVKSGDYGNYNVTQEEAIAPVINLTASYFITLKGDGTFDNPYQP